MPALHGFKRDPRLRGVTFDPNTRKWRARLYAKGRHIALGRYPTQVMAAKAHDCAALYVYGDDALTNYGLDSACKELERHRDGSSATPLIDLSKLELVRAHVSRGEHERRGGRNKVWMKNHRTLAAMIATSALLLDSTTCQTGCSSRRSQLSGVWTDRAITATIATAIRMSM